MNGKYFLYAVFVTVIATGTNWVKMFASTTSTRAGSNWNSHSGGGGGYYGGGGGHK
ncbi:MAG: hypothetical protein QFF03_03475 [Pseudomonadota bacterium]|nr:hypothetical protein [Pseudomonadota bacterium]